MRVLERKGVTKKERERNLHPAAEKEDTEPKKQQENQWKDYIKVTLKGNEKRIVNEPTEEWKQTDVIDKGYCKYFTFRQ